MREKQRQESPIYTKLVAPFRRTRADGSYYYTDADVRHWLPILLIVTGTPEGWNTEAQLLFHEFMGKVGIDGKTEGTVALKKVFAFYEKNPVNAELAQEIRKVLTDLQMDEHDRITKSLGEALKASAPKSHGIGAAFATPRAKGVTKGSPKR